MHSSACPRGAGGGPRPRYELADIFRVYGDSYLCSRTVTPLQRKVMNLIKICRTEALGGHLYKCDECGHERPAYNSCNNRHCPKCQRLVKEQWIESRKKDLLPVQYFHGVFTLPHKLNGLTFINMTVIFEILFKSVAEVLQAFGKDPKWKLAGQLGFTTILHTWDQLLGAHFHIHCLIPGGALSLDRKGWTSSRKDFLFRVEPLSETFRGIFMKHLKSAYEKGELTFRGKTEALADKAAFRKFTDSLYRTNWVVYIKEPFAGPEQVLEYIARYTHRVAITNNRIRRVKNDEVTFSYKKRLPNNRYKIKNKTLPAHEFMRRFLLHVLPNGFMKIRHFGFLSNVRKKQDLATIRACLGEPGQEEAAGRISAPELMLSLTGVDITMCPRCKSGTMRIVATLPKIRAGHDPPTYRRRRCA